MTLPRVCACALALLAGCSDALSADLLGEDQTAVIARNVGTLVEHGHYTRRAIDDTVTEGWMDAYLDRLDPQHMVLLQADVVEFRAHASELDDVIHRRRPDLAIPSEIFDRFTLRMGERVALAKDLLDDPVDFTVDEAWSYDRESAPWPGDAGEARDLWRLRIKAERLDGLTGGETDEQTVQKLARRYDRLARDIGEMEDLDVLALWLGALTSQYDPHSEWWKPSDEADFQIDMAKELQGIGATLSSDDGYTTVSDLVVGGPAERSGLLHPQDRIVGVAQGDGEMVDVVEMRLDRVVKLIRGSKGSTVRLLLWPADAATSGTRREIQITRDRVRLDEQRAQGRLMEAPEAGAPRVGLVTLESFYNGTGGEGTSADVRHLIDELEQQGMEALVLDLRGNGGGSLSEAIALAGMFLTGGPVVQLRDASGDVVSNFDPSPGAAWSGPLVVLTDIFSASASEIVAGALQDYGRAVIVGASSTHGKGTVQVVHDLTELLRTARPSGALKLTTQKFYRVSGGSTQARGVAADIVLPTPFDGREDFRETGLEHFLEWDEIDAAPARRDEALAARIPDLRRRSAERVAADPVLQRIAKWNAWSSARSEATSMSLLQSERERLAKEAEAEAPPEDEDRETAILREAAAVAADLARAIATTKR
jgi:carboxyl-terminal processing protease